MRFDSLVWLHACASLVVHIRVAYSLVRTAGIIFLDFDHCVSGLLFVSLLSTVMIVGDAPFLMNNLEHLNLSFFLRHVNLHIDLFFLIDGDLIGHNECGLWLRVRVLFWQVVEAIVGQDEHLV